MKNNDYMDKLTRTENGEISSGLDDIITHRVNELVEVFPGFSVPSIWGTRTKEEDAIYKKFEEQIGDTLDSTPFRDAYFFKTFLDDIPQEEQYNYVYNTYLYDMNKNGYDSKYVILTRRSVPSYENKPEQFWSSEHSQPMNGLKNEIPLKSPHRIHSVIMATTLASLEKYGFDYNSGGVTDGEVMIENKPFDQEDILFIYKNDDEIEELISYLRNGGMKNSEVIEMLKQTAEERQSHYKGIK